MPAAQEVPRIRSGAGRFAAGTRAVLVISCPLGLLGGLLDAFATSVSRSGARPTAADRVVEQTYAECGAGGSRRCGDRSAQVGRMLMTRERTTTRTPREITDCSAMSP